MRHIADEVKKGMMHFSTMTGQLIHHSTSFSVTDVGQAKAGNCPRNAPARFYHLGRKCGSGPQLPDFDCFGVQKCCRSPMGDMRCVDPESM